MSTIKITQSTDANGKNNEDSSAAIRQGQRAILCIADGVGGLDMGEIASRYITKYIEDKWAGEKDANKMGKKTTVRELNDLFIKLHEDLLDIGSDKKVKLGSTLIVAVVGLGKVIACAVGDSRLYINQDGICRQITVDQTVAEHERTTGERVNCDADEEEKEHLLMEWLGYGKNVPSPKIYEYDIEEDVDILLCTDGLSDTLGEEDIKAELSKRQSGESVLKELTAKAIDNGETDNITAVLYRRRK